MSSLRNYPKPRSRSVPTKVRRRQSDAKWRASVQSCYESLKLIIPEARRFNKRKLSKSLILQETENHILYLEDVLRTLLDEKEKLVDHGMISVTKYRPRTFEEIRDEFARRVQPPVATITKPKKKHVNSPVKKSSTPDKIICTLFKGDQFYYLSGKTFCLQKADPSVHAPCCPWKKSQAAQLLNISGTPGIDSQPATYAGRNLKSTVCVVNGGETSPCSPIPLVTEASPSSKTAKPPLSVSATPGRLDAEDNRAEVFMPQLTPSKRDSDAEGMMSRSPWQSAALSSIQHHPAFLTPSKVTRKLPFDMGSPNLIRFSSPGLRPPPHSPGLGSPGTPFAKEPLFASDLGASFMAVPGTPVLGGTEGDDSEPEDTRSLLCTESIESMELGDEWEWQQELQRKEELRQKKLTTGKQLTPSQEPRDAVSCRPSEEQLQNRPKKTLKRGGLFPADPVCEVTPAKASRPEGRPKCCKQLEKLYDDAEVPVGCRSPPSLSDGEGLHEVPDSPETRSYQQGQLDSPLPSPKQSDCSNFDGYYYFYRKMSGALERHLTSPEMESPSFSEAISQMWADMTDDHRSEMVTMAALEISDSSSTGLSEDLSDITIVPISDFSLIPDMQVVPLSNGESEDLSLEPATATI